MVPLVPVAGFLAVVVSGVDSKHSDAQCFAVYDSLAAFLTYSGTYNSSTSGDISADDDRHTD